MRIVAALGGNALVKRGEPLTLEVQQRNIRIAVKALADLIAEGHQLVITHGNGPHIGMLAQRAALDGGKAEPLDLICAQTVGMIGYLIALELCNAAAAETEITVVLTRIEVDSHDPAFEHPNKPIGSGVTKREAEALAITKGWTFMRDGEMYRRSVASPKPKRIVELNALKALVTAGQHLICAGGGGVPVLRKNNGKHEGVEAVIDKDHSSALLAKLLEADALLLLTDVDGVYRNWSSDKAEKLSSIRAADAQSGAYAAGSMEPKISAAADFVKSTGRFCAIGSLEDAKRLLESKAGTVITI